MEQNKSELIIYSSDDGKVKIDVRLENGTVWLNQAQMVELYQTTKQNISLHIKNIFEEGELQESATVKEYLTVQTEGNRQVTRKQKFYNLEVIIAVGYRVKSLRGTQFRIWATERLREYIQKGFALDDDRLKNAGGGNYWYELLERIRDIRSSEKVLYRQLLDLFATSMDYKANTEDANKFFQIMQNKLHYIATGKTAAELVAERADSDEPFMGVKSFSGKRPRKSEVDIAKNYLTSDELARLNRAVSAFFDIAEFRATNHEPTYMKNWVIQVDELAKTLRAPALQNSGSVSHEKAKQIAESEYEKYKQKTIDELTSVEQDYLENLKSTQKRIERKIKSSDREK